MNKEIIEVFREFKNSSINFAEIILKYNLDKEDSFWENYPFDKDFIEIVDNIIDWYNAVFSRKEEWNRMKILSMLGELLTLLLGMFAIYLWMLILLAIE